MARLAAVLVLAAVVLGIAGLAVVTERGSAQELPDGDRIDLSCTQTGDPDGAGTKGTVECTLALTGLPEPLTDITLDIVVTYVDVDGSGDPSPGDQLQCIAVTLSGVPILDFCRDDVPEPPPIPTAPSP